MSMNIGIFIYDGAEVLDFSGPFEVFATAGRIAESKNVFNVFLIGETGHRITACGGFSVNPQYSFYNHPDIDVLIIPGGIHAPQMENKNVLSWMFKISQQTQITASVCTGSFILAEAGVIKHQQVTTHWDDIADLRSKYKTLIVKENVRWVDEGDVVTSAGISAGIDMSLHLVSRLHSTELAKNTAHTMEFDWTKN